MDNRLEADKSQKHLETLLRFLNKTTDMANELLLQLEDTDYNAMGAFKPYIGPQKNIDALLEFYNRYSSALKEVDDVKAQIEGVMPADKEAFRLEELTKIGLLDKLQRLRDAEDTLDAYGRVKIVAELEKQLVKYIQSVMKKVKNSFFAALDGLPKVPEEANRYAQFILKNSDDKEFLGQYTKKVYERMGFFGIDNNFDALVQQTSDLTKYLNMIVDINMQILGRSASHNINVGLITLIIINLKKVISDMLEMVDKDNKAAWIPHLTRLSGNLKHSDGPMIREIEDLFVFKTPIYKLILNCLIQFFGDLELLEKPNRKYHAEKLNRTMIEILDAFEENKNMKRSWVESYGPSFGVYKTKELGMNFGEKCLAKTQAMAEQFEGLEKYIYLINNYHAFRNHVTVFKETELKKEIEKNCKFIVELWKINTESTKGPKLHKYLMNELEAHRKYYLPEEQRLFVASQLKSIVEGLVARGEFQGQTKDIITGIDSVYSGD